MQLTKLLILKGMDKALLYELIVRRANSNGGRYCVAGADADIFRTMERDWSRTFDGKFIGSDFERGFSLGIVIAFLRDSIKRLIKSGNYSEDVSEELEACYNALLYPSVDVVDKTIDRVVEVIKPL